MARLSFEKKRAQQPAAHPAVVAVRVFGSGGASVGGASVVAAPGEEIQQTVLNHLQRLAISLGAPIRATIHDDRAGCVVPLEVSADGSSRVTGEPVRLPRREESGAPGPRGQGTASAAGAAADVTAPQSVSSVSVKVPTGQFGPAPVMDVPAPAPVPAAVPAPVPAPAPGPVPGAEARGSVTCAPVPTPLAEAAALAPVMDAPVPATTSTPTPPRGFDAVAEEVLGDGPVTETAEGAELLTGPLTRINEDVRAGRIEAAAELADRTVTEASAVLGPDHAEVLHLRELTAYIAYLGDDPVRACRLSLELAALRRRARDAEAAYGNVESAATAWRAVRDPEEGLRLGRDLIDLWTGLSAEPGPAAEDSRPLESARARMVRLADRAARAAQS
ncbi:hypothetical protein AB0N17_30570 [Streptomyces sp. NPDC051133]|uniref:hypothetical protein n=1 Tax=Streptomyces sp. NPDC051133 TaxID=3155521 RepID=UPI00341238B0